MNIKPVSVSYDSAFDNNTVSQTHIDTVSSMFDTTCNTARMYVNQPVIILLLLLLSYILLVHIWIHIPYGPYVHTYTHISLNRQEPYDTADSAQSVWLYERRVWIKNICTHSILVRTCVIYELYYILLERKRKRPRAILTIFSTKSTYILYIYIYVTYIIIYRI